MRVALVGPLQVFTCIQQGRGVAGPVDVGRGLHQYRRLGEFFDRLRWIGLAGTAIALEGILAIDAGRMLAQVGRVDDRDEIGFGLE